MSVKWHPSKKKASFMKRGPRLQKWSLTANANRNHFKLWIQISCLYMYENWGQLISLRTLPLVIHIICFTAHDSSPTLSWFVAALSSGSIFWPANKAASNLAAVISRSYFFMRGKREIGREKVMTNHIHVCGISHCSSQTIGRGISREP